MVSKTFFDNHLDALKECVDLASDEIIGGYDIYQKNYVVTLGDLRTLHYDTDINGWVSFYSYNPDFMGSLKDKFYSFYDGQLWLHYDNTLNRLGESEGYQVFYGWESESSITFIFNPQPSIMKNFLTLSYEGSNGWYGSVMKSGDQGYQGDYDPVGWKLYNDEALTIPSVMVGETFESQTSFGERLTTATWEIR